MFGATKNLTPGAATASFSNYNTAPSHGIHILLLYNIV